MVNDAPPSDLGAERQMLGAMLVNPASIDAVTEIARPEDCYRPGHEAIFRAILALRDAGDPVDPKLVGDRLRIEGELQRAGGLPYLAELVSNLLTSVNAAYYAEIVVRCSAQRALLQAGQRIAQLASAGDVDDVGELQARARREVESAITARSRDEVMWAHESVNRTLSGLEDPPERVSTPWGDLDHLIGGTSPGRLYVIGARPSVGKTVLALQWAAHHAAISGTAGLFFTLEMSRREIDMRLISSAAKVPYGSLQDHELSDRDWQRISSAQGKLASLPLSVVDRANMRIDDIRRIARNVARQRPLGMICVDYLQLLLHDDPRQNRSVQVGDFSRSLKLLAKELEIPVLACTQLNRASEHRSSRLPNMSDIRESGAVEQDADVIVLLHRNVEDPEKAHDLTVAVAKNRFGPPGQIRMQFHGHHQRVEQTAWRPSDVLDTAAASS